MPDVAANGCVSILLRTIFSIIFLYEHTYVLVVGSRLAVNFLLVLFWLAKPLVTSLTKLIPTGDGLWMLKFLMIVSDFQYLEFLPKSPLAGLPVSVECLSPSAGSPVDIEFSPLANLFAFVELLAPLTELSGNVEGILAFEPVVLSLALSRECSLVWSKYHAVFMAKEVVSRLSVCSVCKQSEHKKFLYATNDCKW